MLKITFPEQITKVVPLETHTVAKDVVRSLSEKYEITDVESYHLILCYEPDKLSKLCGHYPIDLFRSDLIPIKNSDLLIDVLNNASRLMEAYNANGTLKLQSHQVYFARKLWFPERTVPSDYLVALLFHQVFLRNVYHPSSLLAIQVVPLFLSGAMFTASELSNAMADNVAQAIACLARIRRCDTNDSVRLRTFIPPVLLQQGTIEQWEVLVKTYLIQLQQQLEDNQVMLHFLEQVQVFQNYGYTLFSALSSSDPRCPGGCTIAIGRAGVRLVDNRTKVITIRWPQLRLIPCM